MVEVAGVEPASPNIRTEASTCLSQSLISPYKLQWAEFCKGILLKLHLDRQRLNSTDYPAIDANPTPQDELVDGLPYKGNATGRTGPGTTCMVLRSSFTVAGTFTLSAFDLCQVFKEAS